MEKPDDPVVKGHVKIGDTHHDHKVNSQIDSSAFTMFPTLQSTTNKRALGQASRYMNANARKQSEQDIGGGTRKSLSSVKRPDCGSKSLQIEPVDEDGTIAESTARISMDIPKGDVPLVSREQSMDIYLLQFGDTDSEQLWTMNVKGPAGKGTSSHEESRLKPLCEYFTKDSVFKTYRDRLVPHDHSCIIICEFCLRDTLPGLEIFQSVGAFKDHIVFMHLWEEHGSTSDYMTCNRSGLSPAWYFNHIEGCMLQWMETRAAENPIRCPIDWCMEGLPIIWR